MERSSSTYKTRVGIFILAALVLFVGVVFYLGKKKNLFSATFGVHGIFRNVSGLQVGNNVRFSGINVGTVSEVLILSDTSVEVEMIIDKDAKKFIKKDARASIGNEGLMGDRVVNISQGTYASAPIEDGGGILTTEPVETDAILNSLRATGENAEIVTYQLAEIFYKINNGQGLLGRLIEDTTFAGDLNQTITNLKHGTEGFTENMEAAKHSILLRGFFKKKEKERGNKDADRNSDNKK